MKSKIKKISDYEYEIPKESNMLVPGKIFSNNKLFKNIDERAIQQLKNVATLPGIQKASLAMPDIHTGYGFTIGGVAAFDLETGIISPGGVGYDINCGVRILGTNIKKSEIVNKRKEILHEIKRSIPSGVGRGNKQKNTIQELREVMTKGSKWALENNLAIKEDLERTEENGCVSPANPKYVSQKALGRGLGHLGTLGAGNHFIDILTIEKIYDNKIAKEFGIEKDNVVIMIHCGSRGLGHQIASDYMKEMENTYGKESFIDIELVNAPIKSELGQRYLSAMNCAVNFAFCNRQIIMCKTREILKKYFPKNKFFQIYDVCHNIAKIEKFKINEKEKELLIHRKGATRSFGPGKKEIPKVYRKVGQPVLLPGSMGTPSYILVGTKTAEEKTFASTAHGAGRERSRAQAHKETTLEQVRQYLEENDILLEAGGAKATIEESPWSYKDPIEVVDVCEKAGLSKKVAKLKPIAVMIG